MKPFTDPFPFRVPETRSSIGEVIAEITKAELKAAEAQDLKELPGAAGEAAHKRLHKTIGKFLKAKPVSEAYRMTPARAEILKREKKKAQKTIDDGMEKEYESGMTDSEHGAAGKAFNRKHRIDLIKMKTKPVTEGKRGVGSYTVIKKRKTVQKGSAADSTPDTTTTEYDVTKRGVKVGSAQRDNYFGQTSGTVHGKSFSGTGSAQTDLHRFLKSKRGATVREEVVQESHTRAQLEKMTTTALRALLKKYTALVAGGSMTAAAELANIRGLLRAKGAGVVLDEAATEVVKARLAAREEKRGGGRAQDKAADAVAVRLGGKTKP